MNDVYEQATTATIAVQILMLIAGVAIVVYATKSWTYSWQASWEVALVC